jgi:predicted transcriptional regulator
MIERVAGKIAPGRAPSFNESQVVKALEIISTYGSVGRIKLSKELELGEGTTRTLLRHAIREKIIECSMHGIGLSDYGKRLFSDLRSRISEGIEIPTSPLTVGPFNVAVLVRNVARGVGRGVEQRDAALKAGASGATTLVFSRNKLIMPTSEEDTFKGIPHLQDMLVFKLDPKENDVIIIGCGEDRRLAEQGAIMAALRLLDQRQRIH